MAHAEHSVTVSRPAAEVFDFIADGANNVRWRPGVIEVERAGGHQGPGRSAHRRRLQGHDVRTPGRLAFEVTSGPARPTGSYTLAPDGSGTRVTFVLDLKPRGFMKVMAPLINKQVREEVANLDNLKTVLEN